MGSSILKPSFITNPQKSLSWFPSTQSNWKLSCLTFETTPVPSQANRNFHTFLQTPCVFILPHLGSWRSPSLKWLLHDPALNVIWHAYVYCLTSHTRIFTRIVTSSILFTTISPTPRTAVAPIFFEYMRIECNCRGPGDSRLEVEELPPKADTIQVDWYLWFKATKLNTRIKIEIENWWQ